MGRRRAIAGSGVLFLLLAAPAFPKTLILHGRLESRIAATQTVTFQVRDDLKSVAFRFALPKTFSNKAVTQTIDGLEVSFVPEPSEVSDAVDAYGNRFRRARWENVRRDIRVRISFDALLRSEVREIVSGAAFPPADVPRDEAVYLKATELVQSGHREIAALSRRLTQGARTEYEAVNAILNWVADNVKYAYNPPRYDALETLSSGKGNCQNYAHLSMALLRSAGIPARIVGGISLSRQWKVPVGDGFLVQSMGQGGHAWIEIYFPDAGWLSYDPQQSRQFTSSRHIKQTHGLDSRDVNDTWSALPYLPPYGESIEAQFRLDEIDVGLSAQTESPRPYILSNAVVAKAELPLPPEVKPLPPPAPVAAKPLPPAAKPVPPPLPPAAKPAPQPSRKGIVEFGNMEFPTLVEVYQAVGNTGTRVLDKETAEYVTSKHVYAQAFTTEGGMALLGVSLAMKKFGGDGFLYVDVVRDDKGKPGLSGERSLPVSLAELKSRPGYYWVDFSFGKAGDALPTLPAGKHWIVLRHSGEAVVNWFFIPGKPYGGGDDTRSTAKGWRWEDILNCDFVFKVRGRSL